MLVDIFVFFLVFYWMEKQQHQSLLSLCFPFSQLLPNFFSSFSTYWSELSPLLLIGHLFNYYSFSKNCIHPHTHILVCADMVNAVLQLLQFNRDLKTARQQLFYCLGWQGKWGWGLLSWAKSWREEDEVKGGWVPGQERRSR